MAEPIEKSNVITIRFRRQNAAAARMLADAVAKAYVVERISVRRNPMLESFFHDRTSGLRDRLLDLRTEQYREVLVEAITDRAVRTAFYAKIDFAVNVITILLQVVITAQLIRVIGLALSLTLVPAIVCLGFLGLGIYPLLAVLVALQVAYRSGRYGIAKPAREVLFTVVSREEKYKSKAFLDAAVYRGGDLVSGWAYAGLAALGLSVGAIALVAAPLAAVWVAVGFGLGRKQEELATDRG